MTRAVRYFLRIIRHKWWVGYYCFKAGLYWRGITHDLSKFSPAEFGPSARYWGSSAFTRPKEDANAYEVAWLHHRGRNPHHYEYWITDIDTGGKALPIPYKYAMESICDYFGASHAYNQDNGQSVYKNTLDWWERDMIGYPKAKIHRQYQAFVTQILKQCAEQDSCEPLRPETSKPLYDKLWNSMVAPLKEWRGWPME